MCLDVYHAFTQVDLTHLRLLLFDLQSRVTRELEGSEVDDPDIEYHYPYHYVLAFSSDRDGTVLAASVASGTITLWNTRSLTKRVVLDCEVPIIVTGAWLSNNHLVLLQKGEDEFSVRVLSLKDGVVENCVVVPHSSAAVVSSACDGVAIVKENFGLLLMRVHGYGSKAAATTAAHSLSLK